MTIADRSANDNPSEKFAMGKSMKRREDPRFLTGQGNYIDDINLPGQLYMALVHSPYPHANILSIDSSAAMQIPGVIAVVTAKELAAHGVGRLPTFHGFDTQMVLADGKVLFQNQEVAFVVAEDRYIAADAAELVEVDYEPLPAVVTPQQAKTDQTIIRADREQQTNHIFNWSVGQQEETEQALAASDHVVKQHIVYQRVHAAPLEPCGCVANFDAMGRLKFYVTSQTPHVYRTALFLVTGIPEDKIQVIAPDIGGGFGNKVPVYPGYICAIAGALVIGRPVKWIETRTENLTSSFARDYHMDIELGATGSYDVPTAFASVDAYFTNKMPGGIAYRCSFRVTEAAYCIERAMDILADDLKIDPVELRRRNFIQPEQFPYQSPLSFTYDSGDYERTMDVALERVGYQDLLKEQAEKRARRADGHRHQHLYGSDRGRAVQELRHPGHQDVRRRRDSHSPQRRWHHPHRHQVAGAGARDHLGADRGRGTGPGPQQFSGGRGRHRHRPLRPGHLCQPQYPGGGRGTGAGGPQDPRKGPKDRRAPAGSR